MESPDQCYADQNSVSLRARTDKQKSKLYDDTVKLNTYKKKLQTVLGPMVLTHYFLCVPEFHSATLVSYANLRAKAVRDYELPFISTDFEILIKTPGDYPAEYQAALHSGTAKALVPAPQISTAQVEGFPAEEPELQKKLVQKLSVLALSKPGAPVDSLRDEFIKWFLTKEGVMEALKAWPETHEAIERQRQLRQDRLAIDNALSVDTPHERVTQLIHEYEAQLLATVGGVTASDAQRLSFGQVGEWLMRCPLEFQGKS